jgi:hypothetical protein
MAMVELFSRREILEVTLRAALWTIADFSNCFGYELAYVLHYAYITSPCTTL